MKRSKIAALAAACLLASPSLAAKGKPPTSLPSASKLKQGKGDNWNYSKPGLDLTRYKQLMIDPTAIDRGPDADFDSVKPADLQKFAAITDEALRKEIGEVFPIVTRPGPDTARLKLTLLGVKKTEKGLATYSRASAVGLAVSAIKSVKGKAGSYTGSVLYAIELSDSRSGELLIAAIRRVSPDALDIPATLSTTETVKAVAKNTASRIRVRLAEQTGRK